MSKEENQKIETINQLAKKMQDGFSVVHKEIILLAKSVAAGTLDDKARNRDLLSKIKESDKTVEDLSFSMAKSFDNIHKKIDDDATETDTKIKNLHFDTSIAKLNTETIKQEIKTIDNELKWMKDVLEKNTGVLLRLDQERAFTLNYVQRIEAEVAKIKKRLKIA